MHIIYRFWKILCAYSYDWPGITIFVFLCYGSEQEPVNSFDHISRNLIKLSLRKALPELVILPRAGKNTISYKSNFLFIPDIVTKKNDVVLVISISFERAS